MPSCCRRCWCWYLWRSWCSNPTTRISSGCYLSRHRRRYHCFVPGVPRTRRRAVMTTYVMLANWTDQGAMKVKDSPRRLDAAKKALKDMNGEFKYFFLTMGDYDIVAIYEAPDDAVAARFSLQLGMLGNIRTRTLKAFPEAAYREIINSLGYSANGVLMKTHGLFRSGIARKSFSAIESF